MTQQEIEAAAAAKKLADDKAAEEKRIADEAAAAAKNSVDAKIADIQKSPDAVKDLLEAKRAANDEAKQLRLKLEKIEAEKAAEVQKKLEEEGKWKEIAAAKDAKLKETEAKANVDRMAMEIKLAAVRLGINNPEDKNLIALPGVSIGEDGIVKGVAEALSLLKTQQPYLFGSTVVPAGAVDGARSNSSGGSLKYEDLMKNGVLAKKIKTENRALYDSLKKAYEEKLY